MPLKKTSSTTSVHASIALRTNSSTSEPSNRAELAPSSEANHDNGGVAIRKSSRKRKSALSTKETDEPPIKKQRIIKLKWKPHIPSAVPSSVSLSMVRKPQLTTSNWTKDELEVAHSLLLLRNPKDYDSDATIDDTSRHATIEPASLLLSLHDGQYDSDATIDNN